MSLFGASTTTSTPLFGTATTATSSPKPLFGGATSSTAPATSSVPLFGTSTAPAATTTTSGGLFGTATSSAAAPTTTTGGLFGSTAAAPAATGGGLFGAKPAATSAAPTLGGGLFGSTPAAAATAASTTPSLGLGGVQHNQAVASTTSGTTTTSLTTGGADKDTTKDGEVQAANFIREMLPAIEERLRKNRELMEEVENSPVADSLAVDEMLDRTRGWISEVRRNVRNASEASKSVAQLAAHDKQLLETAKRVQEQASTANQTAHSSFIKKHLSDRTQIYNLEMCALQTRVNELRAKFEKLLRGEPSLTMAELDEYFQRCDKNAAAAQHHIHEVGREIEELKNQLIEQGYTHLRHRSYAPQTAFYGGGGNDGAEFFPSHTSLAMIGSSLRAPATAAPTAVGGLGLGTGSSLFGSNTGGTSLFGSTSAATKPAFSGGSLFGNLTSTAPATSTTTAATSAGSLFGAKPAATTTSTMPSFGSTLSNNSSGTLFTSKK